MNKGLIHVYYGDGKGKTTASIGLTIRAAGCGLRVVLLQFLKGRNVSEIESLKMLPNITILRNHKDLGFYNTMDDQVKREITQIHNENLERAVEIIKSNQCDMLVMDEIIDAYDHQLVNRKMVEDLIINKKPELEIVLTGHNPNPFFLEHADYITEMKKIKHPYDKKIVARKGIEY